jgi:hypothetical protein
MNETVLEESIDAYLDYFDVRRMFVSFWKLIFF